MNRKLVLMLTLTLLVGTLGLSFEVQRVQASGTIYIRADGSIDPPTAPISTLDNVTYTLTGNITSELYSNNDGIIVEKDNIVIDGNGYMLQGAGTYANSGIDLSGRRNITIKNTNINDFSYGILLSESSNISITENNITSNNWDGIFLYESSNNTISGNHMINNSGLGIGLYWRSGYNSIVGNVLVNDGLNVEFDSYDNVVVDNLVNRKPLVYFDGVSDVVVNDAGQVILFNCNHILVENLTLSNTYKGVQLVRTVSSTITGNTITNNSYGISLEDSSNDNSIVGNTITNNSESGIRLTYGTFSQDDTIVGNTITSNKIGIDVSYENRIYHNNFINNTVVDSYGYARDNVFDDGYPSGGNYWSDYNGTDLSSGPYQNETGSDGVGDSPYVMDTKDIDHYPLMTSYIIPEFPSFLVLPLFVLFTMLAVVFMQRRIPRKQKKGR